MREIKFQYIYELLGVVCRPTLTIEQIEEGLAAKDSFPSNAKIIAKRQYTGLKDCNGVEIYEGDIITCHYGDTFKFIVEFKCGGYRYHQMSGRSITKSNDYLVSIYPLELKVIGNIHENPELLEEKQCK